jgi:hypothetical protein
MRQVDERPQVVFGEKGTVNKPGKVAVILRPSKTWTLVNYPQIKSWLLLGLSFFLFGDHDCQAQEVIDGPDGRKIILYPNGTWVPYGQNDERSTYSPDSLDLAQNMAELKAAEAQEKQLSLKLIRKRMEVANLKSEMDRLQSLTNVTEQELIEAQNRFSIAKQREAAFQDSLNLAKDWTLLLEGVTYLNRGMRARAIERWKESHQVGDYAPKKANSGTPVRDTRDTRDTREYVEENQVQDLMLSPPERPCAFLVSDQTKPSSGQRRDVRPEVLFFHTDPGLENHFKKQDLITGYVNLSSFSAGKQWLVLEIAIASRQAPKLFGKMKENDLIRFKTIKGDEIRLLSNSFDGGYWDELRQAYIYRNQYALGAKEYKLLSEGELDAILVRWSKVQEEYQIYDVDLIARQFACLTNG